MTDKTRTFQTLSSKYFHISNGGITLGVIRDGDGNYFLSSEMCSFGLNAGPALIPLLDAAMVDFIGKSIVDLKLKDIIPTNKMINQSGEDDKDDDYHGV